MLCRREYALYADAKEKLYSYSQRMRHTKLACTCCFAEVQVFKAVNAPVHNIPIMYVLDRV
jgi:hypothetical protein